MLDVAAVEPAHTVLLKRHFRRTRLLAQVEDGCCDARVAMRKALGFRRDADWRRDFERNLKMDPTNKTG